MRNLASLILFSLLTAAVVAQTPLGTSTGYSVPASCTLLSCTIGSGSMTTPGGAIVTFPGANVAITPNATTFIYLDNAGNVDTSLVTFAVGSVPIAIVTANFDHVLTITDVRTSYNFTASSGAAGGGATTIAIPNCTAAGTVLNEGVQLSSQVVGGNTQACVTVAASSSTSVFGVCTNLNAGVCGNSGTAQVAYQGLVPAIFDGGPTTVNDLVVPSSTSGQFTDIGASSPSTGQTVGRVASVNTGAGTLATINWGTGDINSPGSGSGSGTINVAPQYQIPYYSVNPNGKTLSGAAGTTDGSQNTTFHSIATNGAGTGVWTPAVGSKPSAPSTGNDSIYPITSGTYGHAACENANGTSCLTQPELDAFDYGCKEDGSTDDTACANALITAAGSTQSAAVWYGVSSFASNVTFPTNLAIHFSTNGGFKPATSTTTTIKGDIVATPHQQIFFNAYASQGLVDLTGDAIVTTIYPEWWGAIANSGSAGTVNQEAIQAAELGAYGTAGSGRTNASGNTIWNRELHLSGQYTVSGTINAYHMIGFSWTCANRNTCGLIENSSNTILLNGQSVAYGEFRNIAWTTTASQDANHPLVKLDYDGSQGTDLKTQFVDFYSNNFGGGQVGQIGVQISPSGGNAQGSNISFYNPLFLSFNQACLMIGNGSNGTGTTLATNAVSIRVIGGDFQDCIGYGMANYGGGFIDLTLTTFEDGTDIWNSGSRAQTGYDMLCYIAVSGEWCSAENVRSESLYTVSGFGWIINGLYNTDGQRVLTPGSSPPVGAIIQGSSAGGHGVYYQVTGSTSAASGLGTVASPLTAASGTTTSITDNTGGFTVNAWVGWEVSLISTPYQYCIITSNTSSTFTCSAGWVVDWINTATITPGSGTQYIIEPNWGTQTTSGGVTWAAMTKYILGCAGCGTNVLSIVNNLFVPGLQVYGAQPNWQGFTSTRSDAFIFQGNGYLTYSGASPGVQVSAGLSGNGAGGGGGTIDFGHLRKPLFYQTGSLGVPGAGGAVGATNGLSYLHGVQTINCWYGAPSGASGSLGVDLCEGATVGGANTGAWYLDNASASTTPKRLSFDANGNLNVATNVAAKNVTAAVTAGAWQRMGTVIPATSTCSYATIESSIFRRQGAKVLSGVSGTTWIWAAIFTCGFTSSTIDYSESITGAPGTWTTPQAVTGIPANHAHGRLATNTDGTLYNNSGTYYFTACSAPVSCSQIDSFSTTDLFTFSSVATGIYTNGSGWDSGDHLGNSRLINDNGTLYLITEADVGSVWKAAVNTGGTVSGSWSKPTSPQFVNGSGTTGNEFIVKENGTYYAFCHGSPSGVTPSDGIMATASSMTASTWTFASSNFFNRSTVDEGVGTTVGQVADFSLYQSTGSDGLAAGQVYMMYDGAPNQSPAAASPGIHLNMATSTQSLAQLVAGTQGNGTAEANYFNHLSAGTVTIGQTSPSFIDFANPVAASTTDQGHIGYYSTATGNQHLLVAANLYENNGVSIARDDTTMSGVRFGLNPSTTQANTGFFVQFASTSGVITTPLNIGSDSSANPTVALTGSVSISDEGTCTMSSGACTAVNLSRTYSAAPACVATWNGTGTLTGIVKAVSSTTQITISSSVGTDSAHMNWVCFGS